MNMVTQGPGFFSPKASSSITPALLNAGLTPGYGMEDITKKRSSSAIAVNKNVEFLHSIPEAVKELANRDLTGINVLIRVNVNVPSKDGGIADPARIIKTKRIGEFILSRGGTPVFFGHNGSLDKKTGKDKRESLVNVARYMQDNFFPNLVFNENSITEQGVQIGWSDIVQGAPNLLQHVRSADEYEVGPKRMIFAESLARLAGDKNGKNKILIFDAFGDVGSDGASVGTIPFLMDEVYTGPEMVDEFNDLEEEVNKGFDAVIFGGIKTPKLNSLNGLNEALNPGGFMFIASGLTPALESMPDFLKKLIGGDSRRVLITTDYSDETKNDIGPSTQETVLTRLDSLKAGKRIFVNGTMGNMEDKSGKYSVGTDRVWAKLKELAQRGAVNIVVGGDAGSTTVKYKLDKEPNVKTYSGGGVAFSYIANEDLAGLRALARRQEQLKIIKSTLPGRQTELTELTPVEKIYNVGITGGRGRMGRLYLHGFLYDEEYSNMRVRAINGVPLKDIGEFIKTLTTPDSTYGELFPGLEIVGKPIINEKEGYALIEITGFPNQEYDGQKPIVQTILLLDDRTGPVRWKLVGEIFGEQNLTGLGIVESSGNDLESSKVIKKHIASVEDGIVEMGAPPKDEETPIMVFGVNEELLEKLNTQVYSNASCTTGAIAPFANLLHKKFGIKIGAINTLHAPTSDQTPYETFRGDEAARARPGHRIQSPAKTGAAKLLTKLIPGIGNHDGKAIRVGGSLTASVVMEIAELEKPATPEGIRELVIQAAKENPRVIGYGYNLSSKDIIKDTRSAIIDLALIKVSADGKRVLVPVWYDNEWGYAKRVLDSLKRTLISRDKGTRTEDFKTLPKPSKEVKTPKAISASELEGIASEGPLPMPKVPQKVIRGEAVGIYLTGVKEKMKSRNGQIFLRKLLGDARFNLEGIVIEGITKENFKDQMAAFIDSIRFSLDLGNIEGLEITPVLTDKNDMGLIFAAGESKRLVKVLPSLPRDLRPEIKVINVNQVEYSYLKMINTVSDAVKPLGAELHSAILSMSIRPGTEMLDSGKGISAAVNISPVKVDELDKAGILYQAYQTSVTSGSYLFATFSINGIVDKAAIDKAIESIPGISVENNTSNYFVADRAHIIYDKAQTLIIQDKKENVTLASAFLLVNEELNAVTRTLDATTSASSAISTEPQLNFTNVSAVMEALKGIVEVTPTGVKVIDEFALRDSLVDELVYDATFNPDQEIVSQTRKLIKDIAASLGIKPLSTYEHYLQKAKDSRHYTIPAINIRGMAYDTARAVFQSAVSNKVEDSFILEIAKSEISYTSQRPAEYTTSMLAAAIKEGYKHPVYLQGDHFQVASKDYLKNGVEAVEAIKKLIREAIEAGFYQIDLDMSQLVDWSKPNADEQQKNNYITTAELTLYVRQLERELGLDKQGIVVNLGGEIGEIGMGLDKANQQNSTTEDMMAFMNGYLATLRILSQQVGYELKPLTKIAVQTGTKHGGVRDAAGKVAKAKVGFNTLGELGKFARETYGLAGVVQHGASTLPEQYFIIFAGNPAPEGTQIDETLLNTQGKSYLEQHPVAEVHLATAYQDTILEHSEFPAELGNEIKNFILQKYPVKEGQDPNKVFVDNRKNAWGPYKLFVWNLPESIKTPIRRSLKTQFDTVFRNMGMAKASSAVKDTGGIDFRANAMLINYQPLGNFAGLKPKLPVLTQAQLAKFNIDREFSQLDNMVQSEVVPSGERIKELLAACNQKGELEGRREQLMVLLVKIGILEETQCCLKEASNAYKEALVLTETLT
ncbi:MAG: phosphoglycerate kinase [Candidatus Omnitrophica bacterium]|nr:phosphoglycerate kinase [Candidatus Omnitrophota bacterium]